MRLAFSRYEVTTFEPGARLVLTHGFVESPLSTAFFASSPAAIITLGFDVFVQLVIAAITTDPSLIRNSDLSVFILIDLSPSFLSGCDSISMPASLIL